MAEYDISPYNISLQIEQGPHIGSAAGASIELDYDSGYPILLVFDVQGNRYDVQGVEVPEDVTPDNQGEGDYIEEFMADHEGQTLLVESL